MNGYKVHIWCAVYHGEKFSHNSTRTEIVHARNEKEASEKAEALLKPAEDHRPDFDITASKEIIYRIDYLGYIRYRRVIEIDYIPAKGKEGRSWS